MFRVMSILCLAASAIAADTPAAAFTTAHRLPAKVTLSISDKPLKTALDAISDQLEANKLGRLRFDIAPIALSTIPASVSVDVKDVPLSTALDKLFGPHGLAVKVISSEIDPKDGWLRIVKGEVKVVEEPKGPPATAEEEADAKLKLDAAKAAIKDGKTATAKALLGFILRKYPTASVAAEAKKLAEELK